MNAKKILSLMLVLVLSFSLVLTGCNSTPAKTDSTTTTGDDATTTVGDDATTTVGDDTTTAAGDDTTAASGDDTTTAASGDTTDASGTTTAANGEGKTTTAGGKTTTAGGKTTTKGKTTKTTLGDKVDADTVIEASFIRNEDGKTCTDKETGVIFLDDDLSDWKKVYARGNDLFFDNNPDGVFQGDDSRVIAYYDRKESWFTYKLESGITEVGLIAFYSAENKDGTFREGIEFSVSTDNKKWTVVKPKKNDIDVGFGWKQRGYKITGINKKNIYLRIRLTCPEGATPYNPNVSRLRINNIAKMDDADRYLEGRASATFYVDSQKGSDRNDGRTEATAFKTLYAVSNKFLQPGDKVLFKRGQTFNGSVTIRGYGTSGSPITIGAYGTGAKPKISARGGTALNLTAEHVIIDGLEVTNPNGRIGIYVNSANTGKRSNITIQNCYVHDVQTKELEFSYETGGIIVYADGADPTWFDGVKIMNNTVENVARTGILFTTMWAYRPGRWGKEGYYKNDNDGWWPFENCIVAGNTVLDTFGDSIMCCGTRDLIIEKNTVYNAYKTKKQQGIACAALWTTNTNNTKIQYNEVGYTNLPAGCNDGEGFDIDISEVGTIIQYNYSHNNEGGFLLMCNTPEGKDISKNQVIRYNLSVNDGSKAAVFMIAGANPGTQIYNNTVISPANRSVLYTFNLADIPATKFTFTNNIFYGSGEYRTSFKCEDFKFVNNVFAGGAKEISGAGLTVSGSKKDDPKFKNAKATAYKKKAEMIKAFTPTNKIAGASTIKNNGGKDINGTAIGNAAFYGAIKH